MVNVWLVLTGIGCISLTAFVFGFAWRQRERQHQLADLAAARAGFRLRREWLEADFVKRASESGKPRDLIWTSCEFDDDVAFARDRDSGRLRALVGVTISFEAEPGGLMEDVEAVTALRAATALFSFENGEWTTHGQAVFNLDPRETMRHYQHELEVLD